MGNNVTMSEQLLRIMPAVVKTNIQSEEENSIGLGESDRLLKELLLKGPGVPVLTDEGLETSHLFEVADNSVELSLVSSKSEVLTQELDNVINITPVSKHKEEALDKIELPPTFDHDDKYSETQREILFSIRVDREKAELREMTSSRLLNLSISFSLGVLAFSGLAMVGRSLWVKRR